MTRDGGIDFTAEFCINREGEISFDGFGKFFKVFGQLKHLSKKMAEPEIRDLIGTMSKDDSKIQYGMVISSRGFSPECQIVIDQAVTSKSNKIKNIFCKDISFIVKLMLKHKIGLEKIQMKTSYFIDEDWWDEIKKFT